MNYRDYQGPRLHEMESIGEIHEGVHAVRNEGSCPDRDVHLQVETFVAKGDVWID